MGYEMEDAVRPSKEAFTKTLHRSIETWSSHLNAANTTPSLPLSCFDLEALIRHAPSYLAHGMISGTDQIRLDYTETSHEGGDQLYVNGYSSWTTSMGAHCLLEPKRLPLKLLLGNNKPLRMRFTEESTLLEWPGGNDKGSYVGVLVLAWAYVLSAKWMEILGRVDGHDSRIVLDDAMSSSKWQETIEVDLGDGIGEEEVYWWTALLSSNKGYKITTIYNGKIFLAPWSISVLDGQQYRFRIKPYCTSRTSFGPPSSDIALKYLSRFCQYHNLHYQCMAAFSATLFVPYLEANEKVAYLPISRKSVNSTITSQSKKFKNSGLELKDYLSHYMTLSCNTWGLRSLLCSTFFEPNIECNLVSPWLNPAFEIINPMIEKQEYVAIVKILANRRPRLAPLWLGAVIMGVAKSTLIEIRMGLMAIEYHAAAWTDTVQSFIILKPTTTRMESAGRRDAIMREDECRLLFIAGGDRFARGPFGVWKPFGETRMEDADVEVQLHSQCGDGHVIKYEYWHWGHTIDGEEVNDTGFATMFPENIANSTDTGEQTPSCLSIIEGNAANNSSEQLSEHATPSIFSWLRARGYPACEREIYEHPWVYVQESDDDSTPDDSDGQADIPNDVEAWLVDSS